ncbi:DUF2207 domain-containing protein [Wenzhouxiangella sp. XN79A]|uniref:DUF2207 domain-containing protein n=1 Tax=Wenzhouxiangella sp. XN79A TaxID=2724193 RepID=UPI00144A6EA6|nr:DUF2207 domain-containing protein [Wenzhouxiangella sp. XN79A]NKI34020.1 DUF2207 domain-containing protein [Wenzhouxiangella sp. XN79A]
MNRSPALPRLLLLALLAGLAALPAQADERIQRYDAEITIQTDGSLFVAETIDVQAEGRQIRRGIYRDFPTTYRDPFGSRYTVPFDVLTVTRDGRPEPWHTEGVTGGTRLYIGDAGTFLEPGEYRYRIEYTTDRQLGYFDRHDELYWNVTGNDWAFPIDAVTATVRLPGDVDRTDLRIDAYLGEAGAIGDPETDWTAEVLAPDAVEFTGNRALRPYEGLTVAVGFPKGLVPEPSRLERSRRLLADNRGAIVGLVGLLIVIGWQARAWNRVGRDPLPGAIYPRYDAPEGYSPGMLRYVLKFGYDRTATAAALVHMAVNGHLKLDKPDKHFVVMRGEGVPEAQSERALYFALFADGDTLTFKPSEHSRVGKAVKKHEKTLRAALESHYFKHNRRWWMPGLIVALLSVIVMTALAPTEAPGMGPVIALFALLWNGFVGVMVAGLYKGWKQASGLQRVPILIATLFVGPFVLAGLGLIGVLGWQVGVLPMLILVAHLVLTLTFYQLMKAPTERGRDLLDAIEGLQLYLNIAEREDLERRHGGERPVTVEEFERLLPYAIALDSAETWGRRFEDAIRAAEIDGSINSRSWYSPSMVSGGALSGAAISSALAGGLSSGIASSASPPGSSSGGGGGGFSGGGGGGGGGGGW